MFVVSLSLIMFFLLFVNILTWNASSIAILLQFLQELHQENPISFFYKREKRNIYLSCSRLVFKTSIVPFFLLRIIWESQPVPCLFFVAF